VSLQTIAGNLGESSDTATWVITAFAMANGVTVPLTGWFMRRFGVVTTFTTSVALFTVASALCGLAWSLPSLVIFRLLQGAVSGPMIPGSQALLMAVFPPEKRGLALSIWSMTALIGPVMGPILGGYISDHYQWGWIFLINVPIGFLTVGALITKLRPYNTPPMKLPIDVVGLVLLITWVGTLQVVLDLGNNRDWFNNSTIVTMAIISGIAFIAWIIWELTEENPAVDLSLFKGRNFALGTICFTLGYACFFANNLLMPLWLQTQQGYTATWAGLVAAPAGVVSIMISPLNARLSNKIDIRWLASFSLGAFGVSFLMRTGFTSDTDLWHYILPILVQGLAMGVFFISLTTICLDKLPSPHPGRHGPDQLRPHHRRRLCGQRDHHLLGSPRDPAPKPPGRGSEFGEPRLQCLGLADAGVGDRQGPWAGRDDPGADPSGLYPVVDRYLLRQRDRLAGDDGAGVVHPSPRAAFGADCGGLILGD
jgi:DHA2 family multidrug resistance protein